MLSECVITMELLDTAKEKATNYPKIRASIERLQELDELLKLYRADRYVSYELDMMSELAYYTGIIFAGYTFGTGEAIVKGGRYDTLLTYFGKHAPATGFALVVDQLMMALSRQNISIPVEEQTVWIVYNAQNRANAIKIAQKMRKSGEHIEMMRIEADTRRDDMEAAAARFHIKDVIYCI